MSLASCSRSWLVSTWSMCLIGVTAPALTDLLGGQVQVFFCTRLID